MIILANCPINGVAHEDDRLGLGIVLMHPLWDSKIYKIVYVLFESNAFALMAPLVEQRVVSGPVPPVVRLPDSVRHIDTKFFGHMDCAVPQ